MQCRDQYFAAGRTWVKTMWQDILTAISLYLIIEGMIPFIGPNMFRQAVLRIAQMDDNGLRLTGLTVASVGLIMLYIVR